MPLADKVTIEAKSPHAGTIKKVYVEIGQTVEVGNPFFSIAVGEGEATVAVPAAAAAAPAAEPAAAAAAPPCRRRSCRRWTYSPVGQAVSYCLPATRRRRRRRAQNRDASGCCRDEHGDKTRDAGGYGGRDGFTDALPPATNLGGGDGRGDDGRRRLYL